MPSAIAQLSVVAGSPLQDSGGDRLGRVSDVIARLDGADALPPIVGVRARIGGRDVFVPVARIAQLGPDAVRTTTTKLNLGQFERREGEVLLRQDLLDRSLINVETARLVTAREVQLACGDDGVWRVSGIDSSLRPRLRRLVPRGLRGQEPAPEAFVPWSQLVPFVGHVPSSRLKLTARRLARLHPAQIADLVEAASHDEGAEILAAVGSDKELEADVFEELDDEHQVEFLKGRSDEEVAEMMSRMETDDAADLLLEIDQDRRLPILNEMPPGKQVKIRALLSHNPSTAGGLMNPDFAALGPRTTVSAALERLRTADSAAQAISTVCVVDEAGAYLGCLSLSEMVLEVPGGDLDTPIGSMVDGSTPTVTTDADLPEVAQLMTDYNLIALPVLDADSRPVGLIGVDDVLELLLPDEWRRRAGTARG